MIFKTQDAKETFVLNIAEEINNYLSTHYNSKPNRDLIKMYINRGLSNLRMPAEQIQSEEVQEQAEEMIDEILALL